MPYGRRRWRSRRGMRRRHRRLYSRRTKAGRKRIRRVLKRKRVAKAAKKSCAVVWKCMQHLADTNRVYCLLNNAGVQYSSVDLFTGTRTYGRNGGFGGSGTQLAAPTTPIDLGPGIIGIPVYQTNSGTASTTSAYDIPTSDCNPASNNYPNMSPTNAVFPLLAQANPTAPANFTPDATRLGEQAILTRWANKHRFAVEWPPMNTSTVGTAQEFAKYARLHLYEVLLWVPDIKVVTDNYLVVDSQNAALATWNSMLQQRTNWLMKMFNAKLVRRPAADASVSYTINAADYSTMTGTIANAALPTDINIDCPGRELKEFQATGVFDRRKDAKLVWHRHRSWRRPQKTAPNTAGHLFWHNQKHLVSAGINLKTSRRFTWAKQANSATPDATVRQVCPRGVYVYYQVWRFQCAQDDTTYAPQTYLPSIRLQQAGTMRSNVMEWQNV